MKLTDVWALTALVTLGGIKKTQGAMGWQEVKERFDKIGGGKGADPHYHMTEVFMGNAAGNLELQFKAFGREFDLVLEQDNLVFSKDYTHHIVDQYGRRKLVEEDVSCFFSQGAKNGPNVYMSTCGGSLYGFVQDSSGRHPPFRVLLVEDYRESKTSKGSMKVMVYKADVHIDDEWSCGKEEEEDHSHENDSRVLTDLNGQDDIEHLTVPRLSHSERNRNLETKEASRLRSLQTVVGQQTKFIKMLIVNDKERYEEHKGNTHALSMTLLNIVQRELLSKFNDISLYKLQIEVIGMISFSHGDPWGDLGLDSEGEVNQNLLLNEFAAWRTNQLRTGGVPAHGVAHLLSGKRFNGTVVGLANVRTLCSNSAGAGVVQTVGFTDETVSTIIAHELMHNLGAEHTTSSYPGTLVPEPCGEGYIMHPSGIKQRDWSTCTVNWLTMSFGDQNYPEGCSRGSGCIQPTYIRQYPACAETRASRVFTLAPSCGNGIREAGEECDCGSDQCDDIDPCCDGQTCKLKVDALCSADDICCNRDTCKPVPKSAKKSCRASSSSECDQEEFCDGSLSTCPENLFLSTGSPCGNNGTCYAGSCHSHQQQCDGLHLDACPFMANFVGDEGCGNLLCKTSSLQSCFKVRNDEDGSFLMVEDGTPCKMVDKRDGICYNTRCVNTTSVPFPISISCSNGIKDDLETDIDCGGPSCFPCLPKESCQEDRDCFGTDEQPGRCDRPTTAPTMAPTVKIFLRPLGQTCGDFKNAPSCGDYSGCIWMADYGLCKDTGYFPDEVSDTCSPEIYTESCCSGRKLRETCENWLYCSWNSTSSSCFVDPPVQSAAEMPAAAGKSSAVGICREYNTGTGPNFEVSPPGSTDILGNLWRAVQNHLPLVVGSLAGAIFIGSFAGFFICFRNCTKAHPGYGDKARKAAGHAYRVRLQEVLDGSTDPPRRASGPATIQQAAVGRNRPSNSSPVSPVLSSPSSSVTVASVAATAVVAASPSSPRIASSPVPSTPQPPVPTVAPKPTPIAASSATQYNLKPCPVCSINYSNPLNDGARCNSCNNAARAAASPVRYVAHEGNQNRRLPSVVIPVLPTVSPSDPSAPSAPPPSQQQQQQQQPQQASPSRSRTATVPAPSPAHSAPPNDSTVQRSQSVVQSPSAPQTPPLAQAIDDPVDSENVVMGIPARSPSGNSFTTVSHL